MITHVELLRILAYNPDTGIFTWVVSPRGGTARKGSVAGCLKSNGYICIRVRGDKYQAHRLAWFYVTGEWPPDQVDHIDRNKSNNAFVNLRPVTNKQNHENVAIRATNKSGHRGVNWHKASGKWNARVCHHGVRIELGVFDSLDDAALAAKNARALLFTHSSD